MKKVLLLVLFSFTALGFFSNATKKKIDTIENNTASDITLDPNANLIITSGVANRVPYFGASKELLSSSVNDTELSYLSGVTSGLQPQLDGKEPTINLTTNRAVVSNGTGGLTTSATTDTQIGYLSTTTSDVQAQIDNKQPNLTGTNGDLFFWNTTLQNLGIGTNGQLLTVSSGLPSWQDAPVSTTLTLKGDIQTHDGTSNASLAVGTNGQILQANSATLTGLEWIDQPASVSVTTKGDLQTYSTAPDRIAVGTDGQILSADSAEATGLKWIDNNPSPLTTKGDIFTYDTDNQRLPVGTDGQILVVDSAEATGLKWAEPLTDDCTSALDCENSFTALVSSTDAVSKENLDWINGNCTNATTGRATCTFQAGVFTVAPNCHGGVEGDYTNATSVNIISVSNTQIVFETVGTSGAFDTDFNIECNKQGADYTTKNALRPIAARYTTNNGQSIPTSETITVYEDLGFDTDSAYNSGTGVYSVVSGGDGLYLISCSYSHQGNAVRAYYGHIRINSVRVASAAQSRSSSTSDRLTVLRTAIVNLSSGDTVDCTMNANSSGSAMYTDGTFNVFHIHRIGL